MCVALISRKLNIAHDRATNKTVFHRKLKKNSNISKMTYFFPIGCFFPFVDYRITFWLNQFLNMWEQICRFKVPMVFTDINAHKLTYHMGVLVWICYRNICQLYVQKLVHWVKSPTNTVNQIKKVIQNTSTCIPVTCKSFFSIYKLKISKSHFQS